MSEKGTAPDCAFDEAVVAVARKLAPSEADIHYYGSGNPEDLAQTVCEAARPFLVAPVEAERDAYKNELAKL